MIYLNFEEILRNHALRAIVSFALNVQSELSSIIDKNVHVLFSKKFLGKKSMYIINYTILEKEGRENCEIFLVVNIEGVK